MILYAGFHIASGVIPDALWQANCQLVVQATIVVEMIVVLDHKVQDSSSFRNLNFGGPPVPLLFKLCLLEKEILQNQYICNSHKSTNKHRPAFTLTASPYAPAFKAESAMSGHEEKLSRGHEAMALLGQNHESPRVSAERWSDALSLPRVQAPVQAPCDLAVQTGFKATDRTMEKPLPGLQNTPRRI
jgi:hypothetical protein